MRTTGAVTMPFTLTARRAWRKALFPWRVPSGEVKVGEPRGEDAADDRAGHSVRCPNFALVVLDGLGCKQRAL